MTREEFEHILKAVADIVKDEIVVVGSQSVLGQFPDAPESLPRFGRRTGRSSRGL